jgi:hypothetical protein
MAAEGLHYSVLCSRKLLEFVKWLFSHAAYMLACPTNKITAVLFEVIGWLT